MVHGIQICYIIRQYKFSKEEQSRQQELGGWPVRNKQASFQSSWAVSRQVSQCALGKCRVRPRQWLGQMGAGSSQDTSWQEWVGQGLWACLLSEKIKKKKKKRGPGIEEAWGLTSWSLAESMTETSEATAQSHNSPLAQRGAISKTCEAAAWHWLRL